METGRFTLQDNSFISGGKKFYIKQRKNVSSKKPSLYLIQTNPFKYISSLYPKDKEQNTYTFDVDELQIYIIKKDGDKVEIAETE